MVYSCSCCEKISWQQEADNYTQLIQDMLFRFNILGSNRSVKVNYLNKYLNRFQENLGDLSEVQGKIFHQEKKNECQKTKDNGKHTLRQTIVGI
jgi:hypothetical protein